MAAAYAVLATACAIVRKRSVRARARFIISINLIYHYYERAYSVCCFVPLKYNVNAGTCSPMSMFNLFGDLTCDT